MDDNLRNQPLSIRQVAFASAIGSAIEWYDFFLYGTAAALLFPKLFFPKFSTFSGTLASFATFGVAFFARPLGGIVFGHFGDRIGRKSMLVITLLMMGGATSCVGLLPTFNQVGIFASFLLAALRFLQGFAVGGEWGGATLMAIEHAPEDSRNFYGSWPQLGVPIGLMLSTLVFGAFSLLPNDAFFNWGWRLPFLLSLVLVVVGLFIRIRVMESPAFSLVKKLGMQARIPLLEVFRHYRATSLVGISTMFVMGPSYIVLTFTLSYVVGKFHVARYAPLIALLSASAAQFLGIVIFARMADRIGKYPVALWSSGALVALSCPFFWLIDTGRFGLISLTMAAWAFAYGAFYGITGILLADLFDTRVRYSGISFSYQIAAMIGAAPAPIVATALVHWTGGNSWSVAVYLISMCVLSFIGVCFVTQRSGASILEKLQADEI